MANTTVNFGDGIWGISSDQTGIIITSHSYDYSMESGSVENRTGNVVGRTYYNPTATFSIDGLIPITSPWSTALATSITLANGLSSQFINGGGTGGLTVVEGITEESSNKAYKTLKITGIHYYFLSA